MIVQNNCEVVPQVNQSLYTIVYCMTDGRTESEDNKCSQILLEYGKILTM